MAWLIVRAAPGGIPRTLTPGFLLRPRAAATSRGRTPQPRDERLLSPAGASSPSPAVRLRQTACVCGRSTGREAPPSPAPGSGGVATHPNRTGHQESLPDLRFGRLAGPLRQEGHSKVQQSFRDFAVRKGPCRGSGHGFALPGTLILAGDAGSRWEGCCQNCYMVRLTRRFLSYRSNAGEF